MSSSRLHELRSVLQDPTSRERAMHAALRLLLSGGLHGHDALVYASELRLAMLRGSPLGVGGAPELPTLWAAAGWGDAACGRSERRGAPPADAPPWRLRELAELSEELLRALTACPPAADAASDGRRLSIGLLPALLAAADAAHAHASRGHEPAAASGAASSARGLAAPLPSEGALARLLEAEWPAALFVEVVEQGSALCP